MKIKKVFLRDLLNKSVSENNEKLIPVNFYDKGILMQYENLEIPKEMLNQPIMVREHVAKKLANINQKLQEKYSQYTLKITYGYRPYELQKKYFEDYASKLKKNHKFKNEKEFLEKAHQSIAIPEVAGHPTGGAVDLTIFDKEKNHNLDMGSLIDDFYDTEKMTWESEINPEQKNNRELLLELMLSEGFAPYWGEWWHYSYGDREWAVYYDQPESLYSEI